MTLVLIAILAAAALAALAVAAAPRPQALRVRRDPTRAELLAELRRQQEER